MHFSRFKKVLIYTVGGALALFSLIANFGIVRVTQPSAAELIKIASFFPINTMVPLDEFLRSHVSIYREYPKKVEIKEILGAKDAIINAGFLIGNILGIIVLFSLFCLFLWVGRFVFPILGIISLLVGLFSGSWSGVGNFIYWIFLTFIAFIPWYAAIPLISKLYYGAFWLLIMVCSWPFTPMFFVLWLLISGPAWMFLGLSFGVFFDITSGPRNRFAIIAEGKNIFLNIFRIK